MPANAPRKAGRPRSAVLTRERITAHALELVSHEGYQGLTMQRLAASLGVSPSALYNHVASKQDLLQWIQDQVMAGVDATVFDRLPLEQALAAWAVNYRNVFAQHVPLIPVIAVLPVGGSPRTVEMYEKVASTLEAAGMPPERIAPSIVALESFIFGSALDTSAPQDIFDTGTQAGQAPHFSRAVDAQRASGAPATDAAFELGLAAMISGLANGLKNL